MKPGFKRVSKGFLKIFQRVSKEFSKGFQRVSNGFPKGLNFPKPGSFSIYQKIPEIQGGMQMEHDFLIRSNGNFPE